MVAFELMSRSKASTSQNGPVGEKVEEHVGEKVGKHFLIPEALSCNSHFQAELLGGPAPLLVYESLEGS